MKFSTLISVDGLARFLQEPDWIIVDCRFSLDDTEKGRLDYQDAHIPGALYAHLDDDLSGPVEPGKTGRHPLPEIEDFIRKLGSWGISPDTQVVVYDDRSGVIASRLWWMLRWLGHVNVAILDGGYPAWVTEGHPVNNKTVTPEPKIFNPDIQNKLLWTADDVLLRFGDPGYLLIDSRAPERYRGEQEIIDVVAGRIPGAVNYPFENNIDTNGFMHFKQVLQGRFETLLGDVPVEHVTFYCGSGVTAAHNVLAIVHAGLGMPSMYAGSWSEWITDPQRPVVTGD